jgi:hypothetical protein
MHDGGSLMGLDHRCVMTARLLHNHAGYVHACTADVHRVAYQPGYRDCTGFQPYEQVRNKRCPHRTALLQTLPP